MEDGNLTLQSTEIIILGDKKLSKSQNRLKRAHYKLITMDKGPTKTLALRGLKHLWIGPLLKLGRPGPLLKHWWSGVLWKKHWWPGSSLMFIRTYL